MDWLNIADELPIRFVINSIFTLLLLWKAFPNSARKQESMHAFFLFGVSVFLVTYLLHDVEMSMGFAFGLFAVFSMLRYRTESLVVKDMTYLFIVIAMSLISAVSETTIMGLILVHSLICALAQLSSWRSTKNTLKSISIIYEEIENIQADRYNQLIQDLEKRTGLTIHSATVEDIDFLRDTATIKVLYDDPDFKHSHPLSSADQHQHESDKVEHGQHVSVAHQNRHDDD